MSTAAERFRRLMAILPRVAATPRVSLTALAAELDCSPDEVVQELRALVDRFDEPVGEQDAIGVLIEGDSIAVRTNHFLRPMRVTAAELSALELGLAVLAHQADGAEATAIDSLRQKLARCITSLPQDGVHDGIRAGSLTTAIERGVVPALRTALRRQVVIGFGYQAAHVATPEVRTIRPYALLFHHGCWYLSGWCERAEAPRLFRCDRMSRVTLTDRRHTVPADFDVTALMVDGRPFSGEARATLTVRYSSAIARWIAERDGGPVEADGSAIRTMPLADREWAIRHALQYGPDIEILEPVALREELVERLVAMQGGATG